LTEVLVNKILIKLNKSWDYVIKPKHGKSSQILLGNFISAIIEADSGFQAIIKLNISEQTFNRTIKKLFPGVKLRGGGETWSFYLLSLIEHKKCYKCNSILEIKDIAPSQSSCKNCRQEYNKTDNRRIANKLSQRKYYKENPNYFYEKHARYRAQLQNACPKWVDLTVLAEIYKNCPKGYHVDHIIPLNHKEICGLHVPWNLQYLPAKENLAKSNKYEITY
jgi:hypothetical protein